MCSFHYHSWANTKVHNLKDAHPTLESFSHLESFNRNHLQASVCLKLPSSWEAWLCVVTTETLTNCSDKSWRLNTPFLAERHSFRDGWRHSSTAVNLTTRLWNVADGRQKWDLLLLLVSDVWHWILNISTAFFNPGCLTTASFNSYLQNNRNCKVSVHLM